MCRLFGFRSVIPSQMHRSLVAAENALGRQSEKHPDGWGVAYYVEGAPHVTRSPTHALADALFHRLSGVVSSETVVAHVRKATQGPVSMLNCHPFQYGRWVFAHNGDVPSFSRVRDAMLRRIAPSLARFVLGDTDSEVIFFMVLSRLLENGPLKRPRSADEVLTALAIALDDVAEAANATADAPNFLTCILTDGSTMVAHQGGRELYWSTYKRRCPDRDHCTSLAPQCEAPTTTGQVNHLVFSSEPLHGENVWVPLSPGEMVGIDERMHVVRRFRGLRQLAVVA